MGQKNRKWSDAEKRFVVENSEIMSDRDIAAILCRITGDRITGEMVKLIKVRHGHKYPKRKRE